MIGIIMFIAALFMLLVGYPVAFTFASASILFGLLAVIVELWPDVGAGSVGSEFFLMFSGMPFRIFASIMKKTILMAVPLFIFMGIILQKSELAERLLEAMDPRSDHPAVNRSDCPRRCFSTAGRRSL